MHNDYNRIVEAMKGIVVNTLSDLDMSDILVGEVTGVDPLAITVDQKITIPESNILLTKNTCEHTIEMSVDHITEDASGGSGDAAYAPHHHGYVGRKKFLVHNGLVLSDKVILLRESGGQRYIALDRWYNPDRGCTTK